MATIATSQCPGQTRSPCTYQRTMNTPFHLSNAANSAIRNLKQIEVHLQTQLQSQEKELVELRLNNFKLQNDRNMNEHLKARIAGQADEFEELRLRVRKAEQLVLQKDSQLEGGIF